MSRPPPAERLARLARILTDLANEMSPATLPGRWPQTVIDAAAICHQVAWDLTGRIEAPVRPAQKRPDRQMRLLL